MNLCLAETKAGRFAGSARAETKAVWWQQEQRRLGIGGLMRRLRIVGGGPGFFEVDQWEWLSAGSRQHPMQLCVTKTKASRYLCL